jgi:hypothetical protein
MAIKALNPFAPFWYTPPSEKSQDKPTRFKIRGLNGAEMGYLSPEMLVDGAQRAVTQLTGKGIDLCLQHGLIDWENFDNDAGPVLCMPSNFGLIPYPTRVHLAWQIIAASYVDETQKKT